MIPGGRTFLGGALLLALLSPAGSGLASAQVTDPQYLEAKRLFDALDYENSMRVLDQVIAPLIARPPADPVRRQLLPSAYEMRARSKFALGDQDGTRADFVLLLKESPGYMLSGQVSPRAIALFDEVTKATVTNLTLTVTPATAKVEIDGVPALGSGTFPIAVGDHVVAADQPGYRRTQQTVSGIAGMPAELTLALERVSSLVSLLTSPADVDVTIDGVKRGKTAAGPAAPAFAEAITGAGLQPTEVSAAMTIMDLATGSHLIEFTRPCHVRAERRMDISKPDDYTVGPVKLERAVASLSIASSEPNAQVLIDGQARGTAPLTISDLCEGDYNVELRTPFGRFARRIQAHAGDKIALEGIIRPAFALVSSTGSDVAAGTDPRSAIELAFAPSKAFMVFAPPPDQAAQGLKTNQFQAAWLTVDPNGRPSGAFGDTGTFRDLASKLAASFGAQGIASVTAVDRSRMVVLLLAAGSSQPDVLEVRLDTPASIASAVERLDRSPSLFQPTIGLLAIDVADVTGLVIAGVDANGPAAKAGIEVGDTLVTVNGQPVGDSVNLAGLLAARKAGESLSMDLKTRAGMPKHADVAVVLTPRLIGLTEQALLVNPTLVTLRTRLQRTPADSPDTVALRLNTAVALIRAGAWTDAQAELQRVTLPDGPGVGSGTVQYLLALCAEKLGSRADAETALRAAAASNSLLTEDGPPVKELAEAKLAELQRGGTPPR